MGLVNIQNTNFENGVINRNAADLFGSMGQLDPTKFNTFMDDFFSTITMSNETLGGYRDTQVGAAIDSFDALGGIVNLTTGVAAGNRAIITPTSRGNIITAGKPLYFRTKVALGDVANSIFIGGLADDQLGVTPDDGIFFQILDTVATVDIVVRSAAAQIAIASGLATLVDDEDNTLEFYFDAIDRVYYGVNGTPLGFLDLAGLALPVDEIGPTVGVVSGAGAGAKDCAVDYLFCAQER